MITSIKRYGLLGLGTLARTFLSDIRLCTEPAESVHVRIRMNCPFFNSWPLVIENAMVESFGMIIDATPARSGVPSGLSTGE